MADPYGGLNSEAWLKELRLLEPQIREMRAEAAALDAELKSGRKSVAQIESEGRRGARTGAAATRPAAITGTDVAKAEKLTAAEKQELQVLEQQRAARAANLAIQEKQVQAAIALRQATSVSGVRQIGPGGGPLIGRGYTVPSIQAPGGRNLPVPYSPPFSGIPGAGIPAPYPGRFSGPQLALPAGPRQLALPPGPRQLALPAGAIGPTPADTEQAAKFAQTQARAASGATVFGSTVQRNASIMAASSRELTKYGALTTEFISAAARGAVTVRELGNQVTSTIGKFGGWLVAGSAVYGAFGAIQAVGKGAIDAQSGVSQLQRVVNGIDVGDTIQQFRDLSSEFNLPIEDVSNAAFEMGKVFHNQNDALEATRAVLSSIKVGELDVATSSRYLTSIIQGFNLSAGDMAGVFDQINQAQNQFGIRIQDSLAGIAKASGTFKQAGGDLSTLLALITTAKRASGQTGEVIGTAISRSPNFLRKPSNQKVLEQFGIANPEGPITEVYNRAFEVAKTLSGRKLQELAAALGGPQYGARVFTPLLAQGDLFQEALNKTSPEASKGSAANELQSVLAQVSEQLTKVINQMQELGAGLSDAGAFDVFGLLLKTLNGILNIANGLVTIFNGFPEPIRKAAVYAAQFAGVIALARRLNVGQSFGGLEGGLAGRTLTRQSQPAFLYKEGLIAHQGAIAKETETASTAAYRRSLDVQAAKLTLEDEEAALKNLQAEAGKGSVAAAEAVVAQEGQVLIAKDQLTAAYGAELAASTRTRAILLESVAVEESLATVSNFRGTAAERNALAYREAERTGATISSNVGPGVEKAAGLAGATGAGTQTAALKAEAAVNKQRFGLLQQNTRALGTVGGVIATGTQKLQTYSQQAAAKMKLLGTSKIGAGLKSLGTSMVGAARTIGSFLGPLDFLLIGGFVLFDAFSKAKGQVDDINSSLDSAQAATSGEDLQASLQTARDKIGSIGSTTNILGVPIGNPFSFVAAGKSDEQLAEIDRIDSARQAGLQALVTKSPVTDASSAYLFQGDFDKAIEDLVGSYDRSFAGATALAKGADRTAASIRRAVNLTGAEKSATIAKLRQTVADALGGKATYDDLAASIPKPDAPEDLDASIAGYAGAVGSGFGSLDQKRKLFKDALVRGADGINSSNPGDVAGAAAAMDSLVGALTDAAQAELDFDLAFAKGQEERNQAYSAYLRATNPQKITAQTKKLVQQKQAAAAQNNDLIQSLREDIKNTTAIPGVDELRSYLRAAPDVTVPDPAAPEQSKLPSLLGISPPPLLDLLRSKTEDVPEIGPPGQLGKDSPVYDALKALSDSLPNKGALQDALNGAKEDKKAINGVIGSLKDFRKKTIEAIRVSNAQIRETQFQENQALIQARGDLRVAKAPEGVPALREALNTIGTLVANAIERYGKDSKEALALIAQQQQAREAVVAEQLNLIKAQGDFRAAGYGGEGQERQQAAVQISNLQKQLAFMQAHRNQFSASDILGVETQIREARVSLAQAVENDAEALAAAVYDIAAARAAAAGNEVGSARANLQKALYTLRTADTPLEKRTAKADVIGQKAAVRDAIFTRETEDIQYQADIGKLTIQQQIKAYQGLLKTLDINRDQRRDLKRRIEQLKNEAESESGSFDLDVGSIKLPTVYEIRRAIQGGIDGQSQVSLQQNNTYNVNGANADEIVGRVEQRQAESARRNRNMARSAGIL